MVITGMSVTKSVGSEYEKRNCPSVNSIRRSLLACRLKILHLSCRTRDVPVAATNDKSCLNLRKGMLSFCMSSTH